MFSRLQTEPDRLRKAYTQALQIVGFIAIPTMLCLAATARPVVEFLLTSKWLPCVSYLQILCLLGVVEPFWTLSVRLLLGVGKSSVVLKTTLVRYTLMILGIFLIYPWGLTAIVFAEACSGALATLLIAQVAGRELAIRVSSQLRLVLPSIALSLPLAGCLYAIDVMTALGPGATLAIQLSTACLSYWFAAALLRIRAYELVAETVSHHLIGHGKRGDVVAMR
jgi:O-antigen/teichoic acid export membrane protein